MIHICPLYENYSENYHQKLRLKILTGVTWGKRESFGRISMLSVLKRQKTPLLLLKGSLVAYGLNKKFHFEKKKFLFWKKMELNDHDEGIAVTIEVEDEVGFIDHDTVMKHCKDTSTCTVMKDSKNEIPCKNEQFDYRPTIQELMIVAASESDEHVDKTDAGSDIIGFYLRSGKDADVNIVDTRGWTMLHHAVANSKVSLLYTA